MSAKKVIATAIVLASLVGCGGSGSTGSSGPAGASCEELAATPSIEEAWTIDAGTDLDIVLCSNPSTGFAWGDPSIDDEAVIGLLHRAYEAPESSALPVAGAAGIEILTVHGAAPGTATLTLQYRQPWADGSLPSRTYALTVTVTSPSPS